MHIQVISKEWFRPFRDNVPLVGRMAEGLDAIPRTGWVRRGVKNPETDWQHTLSMVDYVEQLAPRLIEHERLAFNRQFSVDQLCQCCFVHDWPEKIDKFDQVTADLPDGERERVRAEKKAREIGHMRRLSETEGPVGLFAYERFLDFEEGRTLAGRLAREMDKLQTMRQAWLYQVMHFNVRAYDFIEHDRAVIQHPVMLAELAKLEAEIKAHSHKV